MLRDRGALLTGLGLGFGLMYFLEPGGGRHRRRLVRDKLTHAGRVGSDAVGATRRDIANRATGAAARLRKAWNDSPAGGDDVVVGRIRSQLGRVVSHPRAIRVTAANGVVTLQGPILLSETRRLVRAVEAVRGVREVVCQLEEHESAGNVPALQGGTTRPGWRREWSPTTRVLAGAAGLALAGYGFTQRGVPRAVLATLGMGLFTQAAANMDVGALRGRWSADDRSEQAVDTGDNGAQTSTPWI